MHNKKKVQMLSAFQAFSRLTLRLSICSIYPLSCICIAIDGRDSQRPLALFARINCLRDIDLHDWLRFTPTGCLSYKGLSTMDCMIGPRFHTFWTSYKDLIKMTCMIGPRFHVFWLLCEELGLMPRGLPFFSDGALQRRKLDTQAS